MSDQGSLSPPAVVMTLGFSTYFGAALGDSETEFKNRRITDVHIVVGRTPDN